MQKKLVVIKTINLNADAFRVWEALTRPELTKRFMFGIEVISQWNVGSPILWKGMMEGRDTVFYKGKIVHCEFARHLKYTHFDVFSKMDDVPSNYLTITYDLTSERGFTRLMITHGDFVNTYDSEKKYCEFDQKWDRMINGLIELLEKKK